MIPAGLLDNNVELFADGKKLMAIYGGKVIPFSALPHSITIHLVDEMMKNPDAIESLRQIGYKCIDDMVERFCWCRFGAFDTAPDLVTGSGETNNEYWDCGHRDNCPFEFTLCDKVRCGDKYLTRKEILVVKLIASGFPDKQICDEANITYLTVISHKKNIYKKLDVHSQAEITAFAYKNNLIS